MKRIEQLDSVNKEEIFVLENQHEITNLNQQHELELLELQEYYERLLEMKDLECPIWKVIDPETMDSHRSQFFYGIKHINKLMNDVGVLQLKSPKIWSPAQFFCYVLYWLRHGPTFQLLENSMPNKSAQNLRDYFFSCIKQLLPWARSKILLPSVEEWKKMISKEMNDIYPNTLFFFVDGTVIEIDHPSDSVTARSHYNTKHAVYADIFFVLVTPTGKSVYVSNIRSGTTHDKTHWDQTDAVQLLSQFYKLDPNVTYAVGGDKAYPKINKPAGWKCYVTMTADKNEAVDNDIIRDPSIARFRAVVEKTIGAIKDWKILFHQSLISKLAIEEVSWIVTVVTALTNYQQEENGKSW